MYDHSDSSSIPFADKSKARRFLTVSRLIKGFDEILRGWEQPPHQWDQRRLTISRMPNASITKILRSQFLEIEQADVTNSFRKQREELKERIDSHQKEWEQITWLASFSVQHRSRAA
jgi:hypothetical protein